MKLWIGVVAIIVTQIACTAVIVYELRDIGRELVPITESVETLEAKLAG